jgi:hypothetical protein
MRLGLSSGAPARTNPGFNVGADSKGRMVAFEKPSPKSVADKIAAASASATFSSSGPLGAGAGDGTEPFVPPRLALAGKRLTFKGYFMEAVPESPVEAARRRVLVFQYYLEDDSVEVLEPGQRNDGMAHGKFLKRTKIPEINIDTLRIGNHVEFFGRVVRIIACDDFTRKYYEGIDRPQPEEEPIDKDAWSKTQESAFARNDPNVFHGVKSSAITRFIEAVNGSSRTASFKKDVKGRFLEYGNQILRFLLIFDGRRHGVGEKYLLW